MKNFEIFALVKGKLTVEDPKCPSGWRGSGVYDKEEPVSLDVKVDVWAKTEENAKRLVKEYDYTADAMIERIDSVEILGCELICEGEDDDGEEEIIEVNY